MPSRSPDDAEYRFLMAPAASVQVRLAGGEPGGPELQVFGNRAGLLSLANVLLWFLANGWRREFLSLRELPFVHLEGSLAVSLRLTLEADTGFDGLLTRTDRGEQFEWVFAQGDIQRVGLVLHQLACDPCHEYDRLRLEERSAAGVHVRMTDAAAWLV
jgi:hypothetical protein